MPKTAGTSFRTILKKHYGGSLLEDYDDKPLGSTHLKSRARAVRGGIERFVRPPRGVKCIHGHFLAVKYIGYTNARFVTWLRDPVERVASHYFYWRKTRKRNGFSPLRQRMLDEDWSLERFCLGPELQNVYHRYLWGVSVKRFDFIGVSELFATDLPSFSRDFLGMEYEAVQRNVNANKLGQSYLADPDFRARVERHHQRDVDLYRWAVKMRAGRIDGSVSAVTAARR